VKSEAAARKPVILAVDDSADLLALMARALGTEYSVLTAADAGAAVALAGGKPRPDLILLDVEMPDVNGFELCRVLKSEAGTASVPIIFLTGKNEPRHQAEGFEAGAVDYITKPINAVVLRARVRTHVALANRRAELERLVQERTAQVAETRLQLARRLARAMELHESAAVGNRVLRIAQYARLMVEAAGGKPEMGEAMAIAAPLHDIGKLGVPSEILRKAGKLSAPDWERVKRHPLLGAEIIGEHKDPLLRLARDIALTHHEHWDGSGYPRGLKGEAIPWSGRAVAIVDAFESMTTTQFYREPKSVDEAAREIEQGAGTRYDPKVVELFRKALPAIRKVHANLADQLGDIINLDFSPGKKKAPAKA
jgi:putative two-component system response regulator